MWAGTIVGDVLSQEGVGHALPSSNMLDNLAFGGGVGVVWWCFRGCLELWGGVWCGVVVWVVGAWVGLGCWWGGDGVGLMWGWCGGGAGVGMGWCNRGMGTCWLAPGWAWCLHREG